MTSLGVEWGAKYTLTAADGTTVVFNDSTDPNFIGVLSPESSGLDSADVREDASDATEEDGGRHGDFYEGRRPVVLQGTIIASSATQRNERVGKLKLVSRALRKDATLKWTPLGGAAVELKLRRQQPLRITKGFVKEFQLPLVAADIFPKSTQIEDDLRGNWQWNTAPVEGFGIDVFGEFIYWSEPITLAGCIGRMKLDGSNAEPEWLKSPGNGIRSIAVDANFIYWSEQTTTSIARCKLDGTNVELEWIKTPTLPQGLAINSEFIYWGDQTLGAIGRAKIDGSAPAAEWLTTPTTEVWDLAVDANFIYWAERGEGGNIGRAKLDGTSPNNKWIEAAISPTDVKVTSKYVYWTESGTGDVGRAKIDGTGASATWWEQPAVSHIAIDNGILYTSSGWLGRRRLEFTNNGDVGSSPIIKIYGPGTEFKIENTTTGEYIELKGVEIKEKEYFEIDFKNHTIKKNGTTYAYNALVFATSKWWKLEPGGNEITVTGLNFSAESKIIWQDTYI